MKVELKGSKMNALKVFIQGYDAGICDWDHSRVLLKTKYHDINVNEFKEALIMNESRSTDEAIIREQVEAFIIEFEHGYYLDKQYEDEVFKGTYFSYEAGAYHDEYYDTLEEAEAAALDYQDFLSPNEKFEIVEVL